MSDHEIGPEYCERCGRELTASDPSPTCAQCAIEMADGRMSARSEPTQQTAEVQAATGAQRLRVWAGAVLAVVLLAVLAMRFPMVLSAFASTPPSHGGTLVTDSVGDRCVGNLWLVADSMAEKKPLVGTLACPASGRPYVTTSESGVTVVSCPNPESHGAHSVSVRSDSLVPEVK